MTRAAAAFLALVSVLPLNAATSLSTGISSICPRTHGAKDPVKGKQNKQLESDGVSVLHYLHIMCRNMNAQVDIDPEPSYKCN